ncbi:putative AC transposase [Bienertia sinuspersici]
MEDESCSLGSLLIHQVTSRYGTSNAKRHIDNCVAYETFLAQNLSHITDFDQRVFVFKFVETILYHSYPLSMLEHRVRFTCDCWSACTTKAFMTLTAHFIDSNWSLKSRILNFHYFSLPLRGVDIYLFFWANQGVEFREEIIFYYL